MELSTMCIIMMLSSGKRMSQIIDSGTTGECRWELTGTSDNYTLTISGSGAMGNYALDESPWYSYRKNIKTLDIQQGITSIGSKAFSFCRGLTSVTIPDSVISIGYQAFACCFGLTELYVKARTPSTLWDNAFEYISAAIPVHVPSGTASAYQNAWGWRNFRNYLEDISG